MGDAPPPEYRIEKGAFIMGDRSVPLPEAAMQFFVEAMRSNTNVLEAVHKNQASLQSEIREFTKDMRDVRERMIRIEAKPQTNREINELRTEVNALKTKLHEAELADAHDHGQAETWSWLGKHLPSLAVIVFSIIAGIYIVITATGRLNPPLSRTESIHEAIASDPAARRPNSN